MLGAIIGDIVGSVHEFEEKKSKEFPLFTKHSHFTDDTVMTIAVAEALLNGGTADNFIDSMKKFGRLYPNASYGGHFRDWLFSDDRRPYNSFGNGSAMRVAPCAWFANSLEEAERLAEISASVTHNHPEGIKGAKATAAAIYLVRTGAFAQGTSSRDIDRIVQEDFDAKVQAGAVSPLQTIPDGDLAAFLESNRENNDPDKDKKQIEAYFASLEHGETVRRTRLKDSRARLAGFLGDRYGYDLSRTLDEIRPGYRFNETCQETVPEAITAFLESKNFEDAIRNAVSLGGDADTLAAIAGSIAEAEYGVWHDILTEGIRHLDDNLSSVINAWLDRGLPTGGLMVANSGELDYKHWGGHEHGGKSPDFSKPRKIKADFRMNETELARVRFGLWPEQMEDKWVIYFENGCICCRRSWTGLKIYEAEVQKCDTGYIIPELTVERDAKIYSNEDDTEDLRTFHYLIGRGILGVELDRPIGKNKSDTDLLAGWSQLGRMMLTSPSDESELNEAVKREIKRQQAAVPAQEDKPSPTGDKADSNSPEAPKKAKASKAKIKADQPEQR